MSVPVSRWKCLLVRLVAKLNNPSLLWNTTRLRYDWML